MSNENFTHLSDEEFHRHFMFCPRDLPALEALERIRTMIEQINTLNKKLVDVQDWMEMQPDVSDA